MDIAVVGNVSMDIVGTSNDKVATQGGAAAYTAISASKVGGQVCLVGRIGMDYRVEYLNNLRKLNIDLSGLKVIENGKSTRFEILHDLFKATYCNYEINVGTGLVPQDIPLSGVNAKITHICPNDPKQQRHFIENLSTKISLDSLSVEIFRAPHDFCRYILPKADFYFPNREEAIMLHHYLTKNKLLHPKDAKEKASHITHSQLTEIASSLQNNFGGILCLKCDEDGVVVVDDGIVRAVPAVKQEAKDPTGAGDTFAGAFLAKYNETNDIYTSALYGCASASFVIQEFGISKMLSVTPAQIDEVAKSLAEES